MSGIATNVRPQKWSGRERDVAVSVGQRAIDSKSIEVNSRDNLVVRQLLPAQDLESGTDNNWGGSNENWIQDWSSGSGSANSYGESYEIDSSNNAEDKVVGFYGITSLSAALDTEQLKFGMGTDGNQGVKREFNIEAMETDEESRALFTTPVVYGANEDGNIEHYLDAANDGKRVVFHGWVAEPVGETLSVATSPPGVGGGTPATRQM